MSGSDGIPSPTSCMHSFGLNLQAVARAACKTGARRPLACRSGSSGVRRPVGTPVDGAVHEAASSDAVSFSQSYSAVELLGK